MNFKVEELIQIITNNRGNHRLFYEEAFAGFKSLAEKELSRHLEAIRHGKPRSIFVNVSEPEDHTRDYDRLLKMLTLTSDSHIELTENQFAQYVMDDWKWKQQWLTSNSKYSRMIKDSIE